MPICDDPNAFVPYTLRGDRGKPNPLRFKLRPLTVSQSRKLRLSNADALKKPTQDEIVDALADSAVKPYVIGWTDQATYSFDALADRLHDEELVELATAIPFASLPTETDLKNSESPA